MCYSGIASLAAIMGRRCPVSYARDARITDGYMPLRSCAKARRATAHSRRPIMPNAKRDRANFNRQTNIKIKIVNLRLNELTIK